MRTLTYSTHWRIFSAPSVWRIIWSTRCATSGASRSRLQLRCCPAADERPAKKRKVEQRYADCASEAKHCQKAGPKKACTNWTNQAAITLPFLSQLSLFRASTFWRTSHHVFLLRLSLSFIASVFSFQYKFVFITSFVQAEQNVET